MAYRQECVTYQASRTGFNLSFPSQAYPEGGTYKAVGGFIYMCALHMGTEDKCRSGSCRANCPGNDMTEGLPNLHSSRDQPLVPLQ